MLSLNTKSLFLPLALMALSLVSLPSCQGFTTTTRITAPSFKGNASIRSNAFDFVHAPIHSKTQTSMAVKKQDGSDSNVGTNQVDWLKIGGMLFNPTNPYSWFIYMFLFIYGASFVNGSS
mmetsp:Transcript_9173/g.5451  ORF Transcript_9173/g.5451 Transcript_9173/m.5451 type:complete len:120 (-) Transcript_9173:205-564(-)